jgi:uncharacterized protein (DUF433 family)
VTTETGHFYVVTHPGISGGEPIIKGTRTTVRAVVEVWRMGTPAEQITSRLPHLTEAQVFDALSYYSDHKTEINALIEQNQIPAELLHPIKPA